MQTTFPGNGRAASGQRVRRHGTAAGLLALGAVAAAAAVVPLPAAGVEAWYSRGLYPRIQNVLTPLANLIPISLIDLGVGVFLALAAVLLRKRYRRGGWKGAARFAGAALAASAIVLYLVFLFTWGLNYRRVPLERKLAYDSGRITRDAALQLSRFAVEQINGGYNRAHAREPGPPLEHAFSEALRAIGHEARTTTGLPKRSLLSWYFRQAGIDGMTNPIFLDIVVNPDLLPVERPEVLAHEWAHLAGYADEAEANFLAWLTCVRGDALAQYSGWLSLYGHLSAGLSPEDRRAVAALLEEGPRADLRAIAARYMRGSPAVRRAQRGVYDAYLRANRVDEGIERYTAVARLVLGTEFGPGWMPRRRHS